MQNRITVDFDKLGYDKAILDATNLVTHINGYIKDVKPDEKKGGQYMGDQLGWLYVQKALNHLTADRTLVHTSLVNYDSFAQDIDAVTKLLELKKILGGFIGYMEGTFILLGMDLMEQANYVLAALKALAKADSSYQIAYDDLHFLYENRAQRAAATAEQQKRIKELEKQLEEFQKQPEVSKPTPPVTP